MRMSWRIGITTVVAAWLLAASAHAGKLDLDLVGSPWTFPSVDETVKLKIKGIGKSTELDAYPGSLELDEYGWTLEVDGEPFVGSADWTHKAPGAKVVKLLLDEDAAQGLAAALGERATDAAAAAGDLDPTVTILVVKTKAKLKLKPNVKFGAVDATLTGRVKVKGVLTDALGVTRKFSVKAQLVGSCQPVSLVSISSLPEGPFTEPEADFSMAVVGSSAPVTVYFADQSQGTITDYSWSFGAATTSNLPNPATTFSAEGTYPITLLVTGPLGADISTKDLVVSGPNVGPQPIPPIKKLFLGSDGSLLDAYDPSLSNFFVGTTQGTGLNFQMALTGDMNEAKRNIVNLAIRANEDTTLIVLMRLKNEIFMGPVTIEAKADPDIKSYTYSTDDAPVLDGKPGDLLRLEVINGSTGQQTAIPFELHLPYSYVFVPSF